MQGTRSRRGVYFRIDERLTPRRRLRGIKRIRFLQHTGLFPIVPQKTDFSFFVCFRRARRPPSPRRVVIKSLQIFQRFAAEQVNMQMVYRLSRVVALIDHHAIAVFKTQLVFQLRDFQKALFQRFRARPVHLRQMREMLFRNTQIVQLRFRFHVADDNHFFILVQSISKQTIILLPPNKLKLP